MCNEKLIRSILFIGLSIGAGVSLFAQVSDNYSAKYKVYELDGEMVMEGEMGAVNIYASMPTQRQLKQGRKRLKKYTRLRWNVHKVYPYALKLSEVLDEIQSDLNAFQNDEEKSTYLKAREKSLFGQYEGDLRRMSRSQGKVLVKLIYRQTGSTSYYLIRDFKSGTAAFFWQSIGLIFGINLKTDYDPEEEVMIEHIVQELEDGGYNICYKRFDYQLR